MSRQAGRSAVPIPIGGRRSVAEAIRAGRVTRLLIARTARRTEGLQGLLEAARRAGLSPEWVEPRSIDRMGLRDPQGVVAFVVPPKELDERAFLTMQFPRDSLVVVLDGIQDPQNFGACARSAEAAGASLLVARRRRAAPLSPAAVKASAGALLHLPVARMANLTRALDHLKDAGFSVVGLDHRAETTIHDGPPPARPLAVVVGSEGPGLSRLVRESCDLLVAIPMSGRTSSLNAAAALAVALFGYAARTS